MRRMSAMSIRRGQCRCRFSGGFLAHFGLGVDSQRVGHPVDVIEVSCDLDGGVDLEIGRFCCSQLPDVVAAAVAGLQGHLGDVVEQCSVLVR